LKFLYERQRHPGEEVAAAKKDEAKPEEKSAKVFSMVKSAAA
jgi:hypothetical protein